MSVPAALISKLTALQAQVKAAGKLQAAPRATLKAIELNTLQLEVDTTIALSVAAGQLDTWVAPRGQIEIVNGFNVAVGSARDQWRLLDMLEVVSRAALNLELIAGDVGVQKERRLMLPT